MVPCTFDLVSRVTINNGVSFVIEGCSESKIMVRNDFCHLVGATALNASDIVTK
jgi:hypothetical protein